MTKKIEEFQLAKPLGDRVLVEYQTQQKTIGGIIIPDTARTGDIKTATVVAVGRGLYTNNGSLIPMEVKVGDKVMLPSGEMSVQKVKLEDKDYFLCREMDLLIVIR